jgi:hypothetical protein
MYGFVWVRCGHTAAASSVERVAISVATGHWGSRSGLARVHGHGHGTQLQFQLSVLSSGTAWRSVAPSGGHARCRLCLAYGGWPGAPRALSAGRVLRDFRDQHVDRPRVFRACTRPQRGVHVLLLRSRSAKILDVFYSFYYVRQKESEPCPWSMILTGHRACESRRIHSHAVL